MPAICHFIFWLVILLQPILKVIECRDTTNMTSITDRHSGFPQSPKGISYSVNEELSRPYPSPKTLSNTRSIKTRVSGPTNIKDDVNISTRQYEDFVLREGVLFTIAETYLTSCSITIFYEAQTSDLAKKLLETLSRWIIKVYLLEKGTLMQEDTWTRSLCDGYIFLVSIGDALVRHASTDHFMTIPYRTNYRPPSLWNYKAYYIIVLLEANGIIPRDLIGLYNFKKTEKLVILQESGETIKLWSHVLFSGVTTLELLDSWSQGKLHKKRNIFPPKFENFYGSPVRVATFELAPFVIYATDDDGNFVERIGVDMQVIRALSQAKNFTVEHVEVGQTAKWGNKYPNGSWDGLIGEVFSESSAIAVCNVFIVGPRWGLIDYSSPYNYMPACFIAPSPKPLPRWQSPILPFTWDTWISIGLSLLVGGALLHVILTLSIRAESSVFRSLTFNYLYMLGSLTSRSIGIMPNHMPGRVYTSFAWIFCLILSTAYSANLMAFLSITQMESPIDTLEELVESNLRIGGHSVWKRQFEMASQKAVRDLVPRMELNIDYHQLFFQVENGEFAFIQNRQFLELNRDAQFTHRGRSTVRIVEECFQNYNVALTLNRNSPLTDSFTLILMNIFESGLVQKWKDEVTRYFHRKYSERRAKTVVESSSSVPLNLGHVQGIFFLLGFGYILAAVALAVESHLIPKCHSSGAVH